MKEKYIHTKRKILRITSLERLIKKKIKGHNWNGQEAPLLAGDATIQKLEI